MKVTRLSEKTIDEFCDGSGLGGKLKEAMQLSDDACREKVSALFASIDPHDRDYSEALNWACTAMENILREER